MTNYVSPFSGDIVQPTDVTFAEVSLFDDVQLYWPQYVNDNQQVAARIMEFAALADSLTVFLPDADQTALGQDILIRNVGNEIFFVERFGGGGSFSVSPGQSFYVYLVGNTTSAGVWSVLQFGAGTSYADAVTLAGVSTTAVAGRLEAALVTNEYITVPTITEANRGNCLVWTGGAETWTLPLVTELSSGWFVLVRNNGTGTLTLNPAVGTSKIDGLVNVELPPGDSCFICVNRDPSKEDFFTVGRARPNSLTYTSASYDVDSIVGSTYSLVGNTPIIQRYIAQSGTRTTDLLIQLPAVTQVYYLINNTGQSGYDVTFQVLGSSQTPIALPDDAQIIMLCDGNTLYVLNQSTIGLLQAQDGSAAAPGFSFANQTSSGMFLKALGVLGLSAGGQEVISFDTTGGTGNYVTRVIGRLRADSISGGTF